MNILKSQRPKGSEVPTSSLNDIMFFLLLFFLIVSSLANPTAIKLLLPKAEGSQQLNTKRINLTVTADKKFFVNEKQVAYPNLESEIQAACAGVTNPTVLLRMPPSASIQELADLLQIGSKQKIKFVLATQPK